jgi:hypothetical protein
MVRQVLEAPTVVQVQLMVVHLAQVFQRTLQMVHTVESAELNFFPEAREAQMENLDQL